MAPNGVELATDPDQVPDLALAFVGEHSDDLEVHAWWSFLVVVGYADSVPAEPATTRQLFMSGRY
jgi:hypothetical protein